MVVVDVVVRGWRGFCRIQSHRRWTRCRPGTGGAVRGGEELGRPGHWSRPRHVGTWSMATSRPARSSPDRSKADSAGAAATWLGSWRWGLAGNGFKATRSRQGAARSDLTLATCTCGSPSDATATGLERQKGGRQQRIEACWDPRLPRTLDLKEHGAVNRQQGSRAPCTLHWGGSSKAIPRAVDATRWGPT